MLNTEMDSDTMQRPGSYEKALDQFRSGQSQILLGTDYPMAPEVITQATMSGLAESSLLDADALEWIERKSALTLFPRFARAD